RDAADTDRFVNVFFEIAIEYVFEHAGITAIVFGSDDDQSVCTRTGGREFVVLDLLARIVSRKVELTDIDQLTLDAFTFLHLLKNKLRNVFTGPAFPHSAENHWNE